MANHSNPQIRPTIIVDNALYELKTRPDEPVMLSVRIPFALRHQLKTQALSEGTTVQAYISRYLEAAVSQ